ncbi:hypothetical protein [Mesorhizobium sp.]|uniref:hypothetical protein n=1 Tax=Mesorhizobium sp. TaxID=1871066 RepID=UPI000FE428B2|nr:hypothetical protein [Mesorhizobium sp.]RWN51933.1 MAG: hypothetical protein EOR98_24065 [Mesorhizobium sp.]RWN73058.1 MAG: hypothetical protein EOS02_25535 [Mesorhizobium sp.]RWN76240.1 MAG: hypothetical protein EOS01_21250 [Mesorhizobium sp.]RWN85986.1 MAG: hypothetical protein EOS04_20645 [Mesorhizobium sp.]RWO11751.1 MAG: hypothetical protein EOS15_21875 [Mesorhizobium sp.]
MTTNSPRARMSAKRRHAIFTEHCTGHNVAPCCLCGEPIHRHEDRWIIEHKRALALLGADVNTNCAPAHFKCGEVKTHAQDLPRVRKAKRQQARHEGTKKPTRGFQAPAGYTYDWRSRRYSRELGEATATEEP